jgi:hypothetical protein
MHTKAGRLEWSRNTQTRPERVETKLTDLRLGRPHHSGLVLHGLEVPGQLVGAAQVQDVVHPRNGDARLRNVGRQSHLRQGTDMALKQVVSLAT